MPDPFHTTACGLISSIEEVCRKYDFRPEDVRIIVEPATATSTLVYARWSHEHRSIVIHSVPVQIYRDNPNAD